MKGYGLAKKNMKKNLEIYYSTRSRYIFYEEEKKCKMHFRETLFLLEKDNN